MGGDTTLAFMDDDSTHRRECSQPKLAGDNGERSPALRHSPRVVSSGQQGPLTIGARRPIVILPEALYESASEELLVSVLGHEGAHIQRHDFFWNALVESLYPWLAFHPCAAA